MSRLKIFLILFAFPFLIQAQKSKDQKRFERQKDYGSLWKEANYKITVETDSLYLQKGQYLYLVGYQGDVKVDLPESWEVKEAYATDSSFVVEFSHLKFEISRYFMSQLDSAIMQLGPQIGLPNEADLIALWNKYNGKF